MTGGGSSAKHLEDCLCVLWRDCPNERFGLDCTNGYELFARVAHYINLFCSSLVKEHLYTRKAILPKGRSILLTL